MSLFDKQAEGNICATLLARPDAVHEVGSRLRVEHLYSEQHRLIYSAILECSADGGVDVVSVSGRLRDRGDLAAAGGGAYIAQICSAAVPHRAAIDAHVDRVLSLARRRRLVAAGEQLACAAADMDTGVDEAAGAAMRLLLDQGARGVSGGTYAECLSLVLERAQQEAAGESGEWSAPWCVDLMGQAELAPGRLSIVGARPGIGKTTWICQSLRAASKQGHTCGLITLEMSARDVAGMQFARESQIDYADLRHGRVTDSDWTRAYAVVGGDEDARWHIRQPSSSWPSVRSEILYMIRVLGCSVVALDYVQLVRVSGGLDKRMQVQTVSNEIKQIALSEGVAVVCAAQLNRDAEGQTPTLRDLKEAGDLEQDSDSVILLHRKDRAPGNTDAIVAKDRWGETGQTHTVSYAGAPPRFADLSWREF